MLFTFFVFYNLFYKGICLMKIVFMGSADFGIPAFEALLMHHDIIGVVSTPAKPQGRGLKLTDSPITVFAQTHGINPVFTPDDLKSDELFRQLSSLHAELFVVVAFKILPKRLFSIPPRGTINIHASLLPKFRGPAPIQRAIEAGEKESGITIFKIDEGVDTGEVLLRKNVPIGPEVTTPQLYETMSSTGAEMLIKAIDNLEHGSGSFYPQEHSLSSKAPKLSKEEAHIKWSDSAETIFNKIRAFKPFPGTYCILDGKRLGIDWAKVIDNCASGNSGTIMNVADNFFDVFCNPGILRILRVKPEGRKVMDVHDYLLGSCLVEGKLLK
jgi:methionyl-tRNA formyltransferase